MKYEGLSRITDSPKYKNWILEGCSEQIAGSDGRPKT